MKASSIKRRFKEKAFAAKVDRTVITRGVESLGITLDEHVEHMITFLGRVQ